MNFHNIWAVARKQFLTLGHDYRTLALMLFAPVLAMLVFGYAFGTGPQHIGVVVVNNDNDPLATQLINSTDHNILDISYQTDENIAQQDVADGKKVAAIIIAKSFSQDVRANLANFDLYLDTTNTQASSAVSQQLNIALQVIAKDRQGKALISINTNYVFPKAKDAKFIDAFLPGIMAFAITLFTILLTLLAFVGERTSGTMDRLRVTPIKESEIVLGYELAFGIIAAAQAILMLLVALFVYHGLVVGSIFLVAIIVILVAIDAQAVGILISAAAQREGQAVQFIPVIIFPVFLLSGIFLPIISLPKWLQPLAYLLPPTWGIQGLRDVMLRGWGLSHLWPALLILVGFAVVFSILAILGLKRSRK